MILDDAFAPVHQSIVDGRIPGAVLGVLRRGRVDFRHEGLACRLPELVAMRQDTMFDLASLTKVVFTTEAILRLVGEGQIALDDTLTVAIPDLRQYDVANAAERRLTFRQCLTHLTHLPAVEPLYTLGLSPRDLRAFILQRVWTPGTSVYSDINFLLLGIAIERLTGVDLGSQPVPAGFTFHPDAASCAATEQCHWRGRVLRGEVHDENACAMGGAAGHAGLFGSAAALLGFAETLLARGPSPWVRLSATRTLGWQIAHDGWPGGPSCSPSTIGHTGFTGTGLWIDFERELAWTLLTNRVHPSRHSDSGIVELRRTVGTTLAR
jgi:CubicO group peptidase (beta-lactamase class C family)